MQVAYICADAGVPVFGTKGCSIHVQEIIRCFQKRGDDVHLIAVRSGGNKPVDWTNVECTLLDCSRYVSEEEREIRLHELAQSLTHQLQGRPFDLVYERYSLWSADAMEWAELHNLPSILEVNAPLIEEQLEHRRLRNQPLATRLRDRAFRAARTIICVSQKIADYVVSHLPQDQWEKVHVVPNGVDTERFSPEIPPLQRLDGFTVGFVGTLKPWHGLESLLEAYIEVRKSIANARLRIVGDGPLRDTLRTRASELGLDDQVTGVDWIGAVPPELVPGYVASFDVAVAPYLDSTEFYFSPLKVYEYMAAGRAVVASRIGQLRELIHHQQNGCLYSPGDSSELAETILNLAMDPEQRTSLGRSAYQTVVSAHSWQTTLKNILGHALAHSSRQTYAPSL